VENSAKITASYRKEDVVRDWLVVDVNGLTVGRAATQIAAILRGKHKAIFTPHVDCGDCVIVLNADKVVMKGKRAEQKTYFRHSLYPGGVTVESFKQLMAEKPERVLESAIKGMLPKNRLGRQMSKKLKIYSGTAHNHEAQQPKEFKLAY